MGSSGSGSYYLWNIISDIPERGATYRIRITPTSSIAGCEIDVLGTPKQIITVNGQEFKVESGNDVLRVWITCDASVIDSVSVYLEKKVTTTTTNTSTDYQTGYAGGGTNGAGYSSTYQGKQNAAGSGGSFGQGANQTTTGYRYCSGAGGGGWYGGGGGQKSDSSMTYVHYSGGGSGFVNTAASAGNRPSGYTGLELDSGTTYAGNTSFPSTSGGTETGHSGNGYVRITRL
jgi:hypothetical protein